jgi:hypothetical protein
MFKNYIESDFYNLLDVAFDRLRPDGISAGFMGTIVFSGVVSLFSGLSIAKTYLIDTPLWSVLLKLNLVMLAVHFFITIFFLNERNAFKYQKVQAVFLCFIMFKVSIEMYMAYFVTYKFRQVPTFMNTIAILMFIGGILYLITSIIRSFFRVKKGEFRENGKGLYDFKKSMGYISLPLIYGVIMSSGVIAKSLSSSTNFTGNIIELTIMLLFCVIIQYGIALTWPEFLLYTYCKFRFKSFEVPMPDRLKKRGASK